MESVLILPHCSLPPSPSLPLSPLQMVWNACHLPQWLELEKQFSELWRRKMQDGTPCKKSQWQKSPQETSPVEDQLETCEIPLWESILQFVRCVETVDSEGFVSLSGVKESHQAHTRLRGSPLLGGSLWLRAFPGAFCPASFLPSFRSLLWRKAALQTIPWVFLFVVFPRWNTMLWQQGPDLLAPLP